ncbi:MAG: DUF58 domain-containing protein [bacterium]
MRFSRRFKPTEPEALKTEQGLLSKKELLEIFVEHRVDSPFPGDWESIFKGSGYEFWGLREIEPGDSAKNIDWKATARTGQYYVREFLAESYFNLMILYDISRSMAFGRKELLQANVAASLAYSAIAANNGCGLITFADTVHDYIPPRMGMGHFLQILLTLVRSGPVDCAGTRLGPPLTKLVNEVPESLTFILSDFLYPWDCPFHFQRTLHGTNKHEVKALQILEEAEAELPAGSSGMILLRDPENRDELLLDLGAWREYNRERRERLGGLRDQMMRAGIDHLVLKPGDDFRRKINAFVRKTTR